MAFAIKSESRFSMSFFRSSGLQEWCQSSDQKLRDAFDTAHNRGTITTMDRRLLQPSAMDRMLAVNAHSRIRLGQALCEEVADRFCVNDDWEHNEPVFFATLIPKGGLRVADERGIDLGDMKRRLKADLRGLDYIAMFEPGYYASLPSADGGPSYQAISWHSHLLIWSVTLQQLAGLLWKLSKGGNHQAVVQEFEPVHAEQVANGGLPETVAYVLKPPSHAYRVTRYPWVDQDREIRLKPDGTPRFYVTQRSSNLRKGERIKVFHAMKHLSFEEVLVAGGQGRALRARALRKAAHRFDHLEEH
jgi:hypothetical protein